MKLMEKFFLGWMQSMFKTKKKLMLLLKDLLLMNFRDDREPDLLTNFLDQLKRYQPTIEN